MRATSQAIKASDVWEVLRADMDVLGSMGKNALGLAPLTQLAGNTPGGDWATNPERLYDKDLTNNGFPGAAGQYAEQAFGTLCLLHDWRIRWSSANTKILGRWTIAYETLYGVWTDIVLNTPTVDADEWTEYELLPGLPVASGVRLYASTYDVDSRQIRQLEVRGWKLE